MFRTVVLDAMGGTRNSCVLRKQTTSFPFGLPRQAALLCAAQTDRPWFVWFVDSTIKFIYFEVRYQTTSVNNTDMISKNNILLDVPCMKRANKGKEVDHKSAARSTETITSF